MGLSLTDLTSQSDLAFSLSKQACKLVCDFKLEIYLFPCWPCNQGSGA